MNVNLLYKDREWKGPEYYIDAKSISGDLGLDTLFTLAGKDCYYREGEVYKVGECDLFLKDVMQKTMLTPLKCADEITYRQEAVKVSVNNQAYVRGLYECSKTALLEWEKLGRYTNSKSTGRDNAAKLITKIEVLRLFSKKLSELKKLILEEGKVISNCGFAFFNERFLSEYNDELEKDIQKVLEAVSFYLPDTDKENAEGIIYKPQISYECGICEGAGFSDFTLVDSSTVSKKFRDPKSTIYKVQEFINSFTADSVSVESDINARNQTSRAEYETVNYIISFTEPFMKNFEHFFDLLHFQSAFYLGALRLHQHFKRYRINYCFPKVVSKERLAFEDLKEFVMCAEQKTDAVGNTCEMNDKLLIIITGANQGGKSTFLRSIGIAQVMMQCGLMVAANRYESGLFPSLFMHFTRREDSEMNSGRLDEELSRMSKIIDNVDDNSLILLNESFATTTERDGSAIAYDIIKALKESGIKVITVTHLLSFAQKIHEECIRDFRGVEKSDVEFLCAERKPDGSRTYKMIVSVPELTSFGLDLYERIISTK